MSEEDAKTKRCCGPEACGRYEFGAPLMVVGDNGQTNIVPGQPRFCIGPLCMAWRTRIVQREVRRMMTVAELAEEQRDGISRSLGDITKPEMAEFTDHYCGLAGTP